MKLTVLLIFLVILRLVTFSHSVPISIMPLFFLVVGIIYYWNKSPSAKQNNLFKSNKLLFLFLLFVIVSLIRSNNPKDAVSYIAFTVCSIALFALLCAFLFRYCFYSPKFQKREDVLIWFCMVPFLLYAVCNFILYYRHVNLGASVLTSGQSTTSAVLLAHIGVIMSRVEFPLEPGFSNYAVYIGGAFTLSFSMFFFSKTKRLITGIASLVFFLTLLFVDSRSSIYYPLIIIFFVILLKIRQTALKSSKLPRLLVYLPLILIIGPSLYLLLLPIVSRISGLEFLSRGGDELVTGNSRSIIWNIATNELFDFKWQHIFGYGADGQYAAGASKKWAYLFVKWADSEFKSPHNTAFSAIFDYGYVGFTVFILMLIDLFKKVAVMWKEKNVIAYPLICYLSYVCCVGITESLGSAYFLNFLYLLILVATIINAESLPMTKVIVSYTKNTGNVNSNEKERNEPDIISPAL